MTESEPATTQLVPRHAGLFLLASVLFAVAVRGGPGVALAALVATSMLAWSINSARVTDEPRLDVTTKRWEGGLLAVVVAFGLLGMLGWWPSAISPTTAALDRLPNLAWIGLGAVTYLKGTRKTRAIRLGVVAVTVVFTALVGLAHLSVEGPKLDVYFLHIEAAGAIADGQNPYTDAVQVPNGAPTAQPGEMITGYPYPPVTAVSYSLGYWAFSDPRFTSLIAWVLMLTVFGVHAVRARNDRALYVMLIMAAIPGWPAVLRAGWTEPLSLSLIGYSYLTWRRANVSASFMGLALASKQYFAVAAPLLLVYRGRDRTRRLVFAALAIIATVGTGLLMDATAFLGSAVELHLSIPPRADSANLIGLFSSLGLQWSPPALLTVGAGLLTAIWAGRLAGDRKVFAQAMALTLGASFLVSSQAVSNYWFLVTGVCVISLLGEGDDSPIDSTRPRESGAVLTTDLDDA